MESFTIARTGQPPLTFRGECLATADGERTAGRERTRWHDLAVYRTEAGKYVVEIKYRTRWQGELDRAYADILPGAAGVQACFAEYNPREWVMGYPDASHYAGKQGRLLEEIERAYQSQVSEILGSAPEFAEVIE